MTPIVHLYVSSICSSFSAETIGTKVTNTTKFCDLLADAIRGYDFTQGLVPGQALIPLDEAVPYISSGYGRSSSDPDDYILQVHRGKVGAYLKRYRAETAIGCSVVVYTKQAYLDDPDIDEDPRDAVKVREDTQVTHVIIAVLSSVHGKKSTLSPYRFVKNLAGGNHEALLWTADEIRDKACEIAEQEDGWSVVADS